MEQSKRKFIEDKLFYKLFNVTYKYVELNIYFFFMVFLFLMLVNMSSTMPAFIFSVLLSLGSGIIGFLGILKYFYADSQKPTDPTIKGYVCLLWQNKKQKLALISVTLISLGILIADYLFIMRFTEFLFFIPLLMLLSLIIMSSCIYSLIMVGENSEQSILIALKKGFILTLKRIDYALAVICLIAFLALAIFAKPQLGLLVLPSLIGKIIFNLYQSLIKKISLSEV